MEVYMKNLLYLCAVAITLVFGFSVQGASQEAMPPNGLEIKVLNDTQTYQTWREIRTDILGLIASQLAQEKIYRFEIVLGDTGRDGHHFLCINGDPGSLYNLRNWIGTITKDVPTVFASRLLYLQKSACSD
jgi:hypothetical protein